MGGHNRGASPVFSRVRLVLVYQNHGALPGRPLGAQGRRVACIEVVQFHVNIYTEQPQCPNQKRITSAMRPWPTFHEKWLVDSQAAEVVLISKAKYMQRPGLPIHITVKLTMRLQVGFH